MCAPRDTGIQQSMSNKFSAAGMNVPVGTHGVPLIGAMLALAMRNRKAGLGNGSPAAQAQKPALGTAAPGTLGGGA